MSLPKWMRWLVLLPVTIAFAADVCRAPDVVAPPPATLKASYGHWFATQYSDDPADAVDICSRTGVVGVNYRRQWREFETAADQSFNWTDFNALFTALRNDSRQKVKTCKVILFVEYKSFNLPGTNEEPNPCPAWLTDSTGRPGYAPNVYGGATVNNVKVISVNISTTSGNGVSPIAITTGSVHNLTTGDKVWIEGVLGNTNANTTTANPQGAVVTVTSTTSFTIAGTGNGNYVAPSPDATLDKAFPKPAFTCKMYNATVYNEFIEMWAEIANHEFTPGLKLDDDVGFEGVIYQETAHGYSGTPPGYTGTGYAAALTKLIQGCALSFKKSRCIFFYNFLTGYQAGLRDGTAAMRAEGLNDTNDPGGTIRAALANNKVCYSGPDLLPDNDTLYLNNTRTYPTMVDHTGCRSNSAQNDSYDTGLTMQQIFDFGVRGTFGYFPEVSDETDGLANNYSDAAQQAAYCGTPAIGNAGTTKDCARAGQPTPRSSGTCINAYFFWNHKTAGTQTWLNALPVIADPANAYSTWTSRCTGGGGTP